MGPEAAVNAVYYNKIMELPEAERAAFVEAKREEYRADVDIYKLASEMVIDGMVTPHNLRNELINRYNAYANKQVSSFKKKNSVLPV
jgi:acetyl-CoA carboxylase carboxyltransferase component